MGPRAEADRHRRRALSEHPHHHPGRSRSRHFEYLLEARTHGLDVVVRAKEKNRRLESEFQPLGMHMHLPKGRHDRFGDPVMASSRPAPPN